MKNMSANLIRILRECLIKDIGYMQEQKKNLFKKETTFRNIIGAAYFFNLANPTSI